MNVKNTQAPAEPWDEPDTRQPGVYGDLSNAEYHGGPGISKSGLDLMDKAPATYRYVTDNPKDREETPAMRIGTAVHAAILEPDMFAATYCRALRRQDVPEAIDDREVLVELVEQVNAERRAAHPNAIQGTEELVERTKAFNETRLPKLSSGGAKAALVERIVSEVEGYAERGAELEDMKAGELKEIVQAENERRPGHLSASGDRKKLAEQLRAEGEEVVLWPEVCDAYEKEHGRTYTMGTSASRHDMAAWLNANGVEVHLWSDVQAQWLENNADKIALKEDEYDQVIAMRNAAFAHPSASKVLRKPGLAEQSVYWADPETGELCRCRPDFWAAEAGIVADVKTTDDASPEGFGQSIKKWRYHVQHPMYLDGCNQAIEQAGLDLPEQRYFVFIAIEKKPPYNVGAYVLDDDSVSVGRAEYRGNLQTYAACRQNDEWPGFADAIETVSLPEWYIRRALPHLATRA